MSQPSWWFLQKSIADVSFLGELLHNRLVHGMAKRRSCVRRSPISRSAHVYMNISETVGISGKLFRAFGDCKPDRNRHNVSIELGKYCFKLGTSSTRRERHQSSLLRRKISKTPCESGVFYNAMFYFCRENWSGYRRAPQISLCSVHGKCIEQTPEKDNPHAYSILLLILNSQFRDRWSIRLSALFLCASLKSFVGNKLDIFSQITAIICFTFRCSLCDASIWPWVACICARFHFRDLQFCIVCFQLQLYHSNIVLGANKFVYLHAGLGTRGDNLNFSNFNVLCARWLPHSCWSIIMSCMQLTSKKVERYQGGCDKLASTNAMVKRLFWTFASQIVPENFVLN